LTVPASRRRLDLEMVARDLAPSRARAQALILAGSVLVNGQVCSRAGQPVAGQDQVTLVAPQQFVSRGGQKLAHALDRFDVSVVGAVAADLGASTGGFTDCLLQAGARRVYAVDVGYGQLDLRLRSDGRVVVMDRTNARYLECLPEPVDLVVIDVSFISLGLILPVAARLLREGGRAIALIKPQFEAGRAEVGKGGVVRSAAVRREVLERVLAQAQSVGFTVEGLTASPLVGPAGNVEFLVDLCPGGESAGSERLDSWIATAMTEAEAVEGKR
jgi:23S rRNA (cytidine1920-2'-O)/16S rRNA (cytidine1409-2'-O)-methyltransferase